MSKKEATRKVELSFDENVRKGSVREAQLVYLQPMSAKTFEELSDIESDFNVWIDELLEENWALRKHYKELKKSLEFNNSELDTLKEENKKFGVEVALLKDSLHDTGEDINNMHEDLGTAIKPTWRLRTLHT